MGDDRTTVELPKAPAGSRYSVKRANTQDDRASSPLVERVSVVNTGAMRLARPGTDPLPNEVRWRVEMADDRVTLRAAGVQIDLTLDEARRIAETILRAK
jgi:hypothetical protein